MIDARIKLTVLQDNASTFTDHSNDAVDYLRDTFTLAMAGGTDFLYIGYHKQVNAVYAEIDTVDASGSTLLVERFDGTVWVPVVHLDETEGMSRSGFITWDKAFDSDPHEEIAPPEVEVDGITQTFIRFSYDNGNTAVLDGLNLVFSDDQMLKREFPNILDPRILGAGQTSHITHHVASRNLMVQTLRNEGYIKHNDVTGIESINQFDLIDIYEIREAATYLALSKIFFILSDEIGDNWWSKHKEYHKLYNQTFNTAKLSVDTDDDGIAEIDEKLIPRKSMRFSR